jgi:WD40 repeat protein
MAQQWVKDKHNGAGSFFQTWPKDARAYALRYFPTHLRLSRGLDTPGLADVLTDFDFVLDRCEVGAAGHMIDDLLSRHNQPSSPELNAWRLFMGVSGYLLRQASLSDKAHHVLIQIALERPEGDPLRQAAMASTLRRPVAWTSLLREQATIGPPGLALAIDLGALVADVTKDFAGSASHVDVQSMEVHWLSRRLAVATAQADIMLFDIDSGLRIKRFDTNHFGCQLMKFSLIGDRLATVLDGCSRHPKQRVSDTDSLTPSARVLRVWSLLGAMPQAPLFSVELPTVGACSLDFEADGSIQVVYLTGEVVAVDTAGHLCEIQEKITSSGTVTPPCLPAPIKLSASSVDGSIYAFACKDGSLWRYWPISGQCLRLEDPTIEPPGKDVASNSRSSQGIYGLAVSADGRSTAAVGEDGRLRVWRGAELWTAPIAHAYRATHVCLSTDAREALTAGGDSKLHLWNLDASVIQGHENEVTALANIKAVDGFARRIVSGDDQGVICIREEPALTPMPGLRWQAHSARIWDLIGTQCGRWLVSAGDDGKVCIWNAKSGECVTEYIPEPRRKPACHALAISPDGGTLVITAGALIEAWDLPELINCGEFLQPKWPRSDKKLHKGNVRALCFLSNDWLVSAGNDSNAFVISAKDGAELSKLDHSSSRTYVTVATTTITQGLYSLARSACGRFLACSGRGQDRAITIWNLTDPAQPRLVNILHGHWRGTHFLAFTADGENLWSGSWDQTLALWNWQSDTKSRQLVRSVPQLSVALMDPESDRLFVGTAIGETYSLRLLET